MSLYSSIDVPSEEARPSKKRGFAGLYDEPTTAAVIEAAPVTYARAADTDSREAVASKSNAALQFAPPSKRRPLPVKRRPLNSEASSANEDIQSGTQSSSPKPPVASSKAPRLDVINTFDDYAEYQPENTDTQISNSRSKKKHKKPQFIPRDLGWDDDYDPMRPTDFEDYMRSDERRQERAEYKAHREARRRKEQGDTASEMQSQTSREESPERPSFGASRKTKALVPSDTTSNYPQPPPPAGSAHAALSAPPSAADLSTESAEEAYARRAGLSGSTFSAPRTQSSFPIVQLSDGNPQERTTYTAEPTNQPTITEPPGSPPQKKKQSSATTFAQRYMAAHGWKKGQGLGASSSGRLAPLFVKPQKDGTGKIVDRHRNTTARAVVSRVVLIQGILQPGAEVDDLFQQEIGDTCSATYGQVERVTMSVPLGRVFVKFVDGISALRCLNTVAEEFNGKRVRVQNYPDEAFEAGKWDVQVEEN